MLDRINYNYTELIQKIFHYLFKFFLLEWDVFTADIADYPIIYVYVSQYHEIKSTMKEKK